MVISNFGYFCRLYTKTGPSEVGEVVTPPIPWTTHEPLFCGCSQSEVPGHSFLGRSGHMAEKRTSDISIRKSCAKLRILRISLRIFTNFTLCREKARRGLFRKIPRLPLAIGTAYTFSVIIHDSLTISEGGNKDHLKTKRFSVLVNSQFVTTD